MSGLAAPGPAPSSTSASASTAASSSRTQKRIIVACDGTWYDADSNAKRDRSWLSHPLDNSKHLVAPSNATRLCRCINREGYNAQGGPIPQIVFYQSGVGSSSWLSAHLAGGATGVGLSENIRDAYSFICANFEKGSDLLGKEDDEVFLFGFSRGAFTVRSISSLIKTIGILSEEGLMHFYSIFKDWEHQRDVKWPSKTPLAQDPFGSRQDPRPHITHSDYFTRLKSLGYIRVDPENVRIKCCGVWDTVGALGIPTVWVIPQRVSDKYSFVNTTVPGNIEYAFQALALDEHRRPFSPTVWEKPDKNQWPRVLRQTWFRGVHVDVGGGNQPNQELANLSFAWMVSLLEDFRLLDINRAAFWAQIRQSALAQHVANTDPHAPDRASGLSDWGQGRIHQSIDSDWVFRCSFGIKPRTPRAYRKQKTTWYQRWLYPSVYRPFGGVEPPLLEHTNESVHFSVRHRGDGGGKALSGWFTQPRVGGGGEGEGEGEGEEGNGGSQEWEWVREDRHPMWEDRMGRLEQELRLMWPQVRRAVEERGGREGEMVGP